MNMSKKEYQAREAQWVVKSKLHVVGHCIWGLEKSLAAFPSSWHHSCWLCCFPILLGFKFLRVENSKA